MNTCKFLVSLAVLFTSLTGCASVLKNTSQQANTDQSSPATIGADGFPDIWWAPVPQGEVVPGWEITPDKANRQAGEVILSKRNELGLLSNFAAAPFTLDGDNYASIEGLWQSLKYPEGPDDERSKDPSIVWPYTRAQVMAMTAFDAKHAGEVGSANMKKLGIKWVTYKGQKIFYSGVDKQAHYEIMLRASREKLASNPHIKDVLMSTKNLRLMPDHVQEPGLPPAYQYFDIYMKLRAEFQASGIH